MRYYLTQDHFHYDDSGYYGYILFSGTNAELRDLLKALGRGEKPHGFGWHRWGRSFRPANNKVVYDYYIRLRGKTGNKPSREMVDEFLKAALPPRESLRGEKEQIEPTPDRAEKTETTQATIASHISTETPPWAHELLSRVDTIDSRLDANLPILRERLPLLNDSLTDLRNTFDPIRESISRVSADLAQARLAEEQVKQLLSEKETEVEALSQELDRLKNQPHEQANFPKDSRIELLQNQHDKDIKTAQRKIDNLKAELADEQKAKKTLISERDYWMNQEAERSKALKQAESESDISEELESVSDENARFENSLDQILDVVFPELELVHDSPNLIHDAPQMQLLKVLRKIVIDRDIRAKNVKKTKDWYEQHLSKRWRIYFCNEQSLLNGKVTVMVSTKNKQERDFDWLRANPPESCL